MIPFQIKNFGTLLFAPHVLYLDSKSILNFKFVFQKVADFYFKALSFQIQVIEFIVRVAFMCFRF
jgi:hypothetical protein